MAKSDMIEVEGVVVESLPNTCLLYTSDAADDKVTVEMSPYDLTRGRITWRSK